MRKEWKKNKNKIVYKILSIIAVFLMIMGINIHSISAAENESYDYKYVDNYEFGDSKKAVIFKLKDESGEIYYAYCVDKDTRIQKNHDYSRVNVEDSDYYSESDAKQIRAIVRNAYPFQSLEYMQETFNIPTLTKGEAIDAIQFAIWNYANSYQGDLVNGSNENVKNLYNQLISLPAAEQITTIAEINFLEPSAIFNGESYDVDFAYKVTGKNVDGTTVSGDYSFEEDLVVQYGATIEEAGVDENGYTHIIVKNLPSKTTVNLTVNATQDLGRDVYFYDPEGGRNASQSLIGIHEGNTNISKSISFTTEAVSEIVIKKVDSDNNEKLLQGAEFTITSIDKGYTITVVTDENGLALVKLPLGQYTIAETKAPEGYAIIEEVKTIDVTGEVTEATVFVFENKRIIGSVVITKVDKDNKNALAGAEFIIKNENGEEVARGKTDETGVVKFTELPYGKYTYQEVIAPKGYVLDSKEYSFAITIDNEEVKTIDVTGEVTEATVFVFENKKIIQEPKPTPQPQPAPKPTPQPGPKPAQEQSNISKKPSNNNISELPKTGDASIMGFVGALLLSVGGLLINDRK